MHWVHTTCRASEKAYDHYAGYILDALTGAGIRELFCLPGVQNDELFDALYARQSLLRPIQTRHEQGAAYMALGAACATGKPQAYCVVPGPGFLNTTAALSTAYGLSAPVLALTGEIPNGAIGKGIGLLHEIPDQSAVMASLTKWQTRIDSGSETRQKTASAMCALLHGRPRPVGLQVPMDVWAQAPGDDAPAASVRIVCLSIATLSRQWHVPYCARSDRSLSWVAARWARPARSARLRSAYRRQ